MLPVLFIDSVADLFNVEPISNSSWGAIALISIAIFVSMKVTRRVLNHFVHEVNPQYTPDHYERVG